jgi:carbamoyltransferase
VQASAIVNLPFRLWMGLGRRYGYSKVPKIVQVSHHNAHAAVFNVSPFEEAAVLVMDGYGDDTSTSGYIGQGTKLERVWQSHFFDRDRHGARRLRWSNLCRQIPRID